ncbi:MAG: cell division protein FtsA [Blastocatellia bacterium]|nr:cell division protein FtsA [Blastocatellia bacterium]
MARKYSNHIVGLDIGTTNVRAVFAEPLDGKLEVVGIGEAESKGLRKGVIVNPDAAVDSIKRAIELAERTSGLHAEEAYVALGGSHIKGHNSQGVIAVSSRHREITREDVQRVIDGACAVSIPSGREIADVLPQEYTVDDQDGIGDPLGMLGSRLAVSVRIITSPIAAKQNIVTSVNRAGLMVADMLLAPLAAAEAILNDEDREFGTALVDIGGETTNLAIYQRGSIWHTAVFPIGGNHFTNDIAFGLRTPIPEAERIKREFGCTYRQLLDQNSAAEMIEVPSVGGREPRLLSRDILCGILEPRAEELLTQVQDEIRASGFDRQLSSGIILTGGGSLLTGLVEVAEQIFDAPVRCSGANDVGSPFDEITTPGYATAVGLAIYGSRRGGQFHQAKLGRSQAASVSMAAKVKSMFGSFLNL